MHELGIVLHVIDQVEELAKENNVSKVTRLTLEVGEVSSIVPSYFSDCFEWAKKKTEYMQDTELEMIILGGVSYRKRLQKDLQDNGIRKKMPALRQRQHLSRDRQRTAHQGHCGC